jgi:hypothetical protein
VNVARVPVPAEPPPGTVVVEIDPAAMREYLFRTRAQAEFPDAGDDRKRLRVALREHLGLDPEHRRKPAEQVVHVAPLSPVANELWVFWENEENAHPVLLGHRSGEPEMWEHQTWASGPTTS